MIKFGRNGKQSQTDGLMSKQGTGSIAVPNMLQDYVSAESRLEDLNDKGMTSPKAWREHEAVYRSMDALRDSFRPGGMTFTPGGPEDDDGVW